MRRQQRQRASAIMPLGLGMGMGGRPTGAVIMMIAAPANVEGSGIVGPLAFGNANEQMMREREAFRALATQMENRRINSSSTVTTSSFPPLSGPIPSTTSATTTTVSSSSSATTTSSSGSTGSTGARVRSLSELCDSLFQRATSRLASAHGSQCMTAVSTTTRPLPQTLEETEEALSRMTLRALKELVTSLSLQGGSEEIQVLRTACLNTIYTIIRTASTAWKADCAAKRQRENANKQGQGSKANKRARYSTNANGEEDPVLPSLFEDVFNDPFSASAGLEDHDGSLSLFGHDDPLSFADDLFPSFSSAGYGSSSSSSSGLSASLARAKPFLPQKDGESLLCIVKHFGLVLGEHRDFNYANGTVSVNQYMEALAKCNKAYPFEDLLAMMKE